MTCASMAPPAVWWFALASWRPASPTAKSLKAPQLPTGYDEAGNLTQVGLGFAKSQGLTSGPVAGVRTEGNKSYLVAQKLEAGQGAAQLLSEAVPRWISALRFRKTMRWDRSEGRPSVDRFAGFCACTAAR